MRNVITKLVQEGLLFRIPGKGTYVAEPKIVAHSLTYAGIREQLEQMGYEVSTRLISMGLETVDQKIMEHFPGLDDPHFYVVRRLRMLKGEPLSIHISYLPHAYCPGIDQYDLSGEQLCTVLSRVYGLNRAKAVETLESVAASSTEASLLNIFPGQPLLLLQDRILDANGRRVSQNTAKSIHPFGWMLFLLQTAAFMRGITCRTDDGPPDARERPPSARR